MSGTNDDFPTVTPAQLVGKVILSDADIYE